MLENFKREISRSNIVTFDIFDTVITRAVPSPHDVHTAVAGRMEGIPGSRGFRRKRIDAERTVALRHGGLCLYSIQEIYEELGKKCNWPDKTTKQVCKLEIETELEMCIPFQPGVELLDFARQKGLFKGFVSDMYLPAELIQAMLEKVGLYEENDRIHVSCDAKASKSDGAIFRQLAKQYHWAPSDWTHVGDNPLGDGEAPSSLGIKVCLLPRPAVSKRIRKIYKPWRFKREDHDKMMLMGVAQHVSRIGQCQPLNDRQQIIWNTGATFVAPQMVAFSRWIVEQAVKDGVDEIWCLARDGQIVSKILNEHESSVQKNDLKIRYVPASRQAFRLAALREIDNEALEWILDNPELLSFSAIHSRLGGTDEIARMLRGILGEELEGSNAQMNPAMVETLKRELPLESNASIIVATAAQQRSLFLKFLEQTGAGRNFAVVDIGWKGSLQQNLAVILAGTTWEQESYTGYYFGLRANRRISGQCLMKGFNFESMESGGFEWKATNVFELFFAADHPQVQGFTQNENGEAGSALLPEETWRDKMDWGVRIQQDAIVAYAKILKQHVDAAAILNREIAWEMLLVFMCSPTPQEAEVFSEWKVDSLQGIDTGNHLGSKLGWNNILEYARNKGMACHHWRPFVASSNPWYLLLAYRLLLRYRIPGSK